MMQLYSHINADSQKVLAGFQALICLNHQKHNLTLFLQ